MWRWKWVSTIWHGLPTRIVLEEALADGEQLALQALHLRVCAASFQPGDECSLWPAVVNPVDGVGPPGKWRIIGVEGAQVVDVSQQNGPMQRCLGPS